MDRLIFTSLAGQKFIDQRMQQLTNEISNVSTTGFKRSFSAALETFRYEGDGFRSRYVPVVKPQENLDMTPGTVMSTGRNLDVSLDAKQLLAVRPMDGNCVAYTRRGDLKLDSDGSLRVGSGEAVLDLAGNPITVPGSVEVKVGSDGTIFTRQPADAVVTYVPVARMQIVDPGQDPVRVRADGLYRSESGNPFPEADRPAVESGSLESSNTNLFASVVDMITMTRRYEVQVKLLKQASDLSERSQSLARLDK